MSVAFRRAGILVRQLPDQAEAGPQPIVNEVYGRIMAVPYRTNIYKSFHR